MRPPAEPPPDFPRSPEVDAALARQVVLPFQHGGVRLDIGAAPELDPLIGDDCHPDRLPYWALVWDSAPALARWLLNHEPLLGRRVLELGCGAGLPGLVAAAAGARVTLTDRFREAVFLAGENARRNGLEHAVELVTADWRSWPLRERWDLILASDVLYERPLHLPLVEVLGHTLTPGGSCLLADPGRPMSAPFFELARRAGFDVRLEARAPAGLSGEVGVFRIWREGGFIRPEEPLPQPLRPTGTRWERGAF